MLEYVPNERVAIKIADAVLSQIYGEDTINQEKPLSAKLNGDVWIVKGNLPITVKGGESIIKISKKSGEILFVCHDK